MKTTNKAKNLCRRTDYLFLSPLTADANPPTGCEVISLFNILDSIGIDG